MKNRNIQMMKKKGKGRRKRRIQRERNQMGGNLLFSKKIRELTCGILHQILQIRKEIEQIIGTTTEIVETTIEIVEITTEILGTTTETLKTIGIIEIAETIDKNTTREETKIEEVTKEDIILHLYLLMDHLHKNRYIMEIILNINMHHLHNNKCKLKCQIKCHLKCQIKCHLKCQIKCLMHSLSTIPFLDNKCQILLLMGNNSNSSFYTNNPHLKFNNPHLKFNNQHLQFKFKNLHSFQVSYLYGNKVHQLTRHH
jgi:hypothetical protein